MAHASPRSWIDTRLWLLPAIITIALGLPRLFLDQYQVDTALYAGVAWRWATAEPFWSWWTPMAGPIESNAPDPEGATLAVPYFNKPPLLMWIHAAWFQVFRPFIDPATGGPPLWAIRLPVILQAAAAASLTALAARRLAGPKVGLLAGLILALSFPIFVHLDRFILDYAVTALITAAVCLALPRTPRGTPSTPRLILAGVPIGLAMLVKPIFPLYALVLLAAFFLLRRQCRPALLMLPAAALAIAVAAPWHVSMVLKWGDVFTDQYLGRETLDRAAGDLGRGKPWWFYAEVIALRFLPWSVFALLAIITLTSREIRNKTLAALGRSQPLVLFTTVWLVGWFAVLIPFGDARPRYMMHLWPALAALAALYIARLAPAAPPLKIRGPGTHRLGKLTAIVAVLAAIATIPITLTAERPHPEAARAAALAELIDASSTDSTTLWNATLAPPREAELYLRLGSWPARLHDPARTPNQHPAPGDLVICHTDRLAEYRHSLAPFGRPVPVGAADDYTLVRITNPAPE